MHLSVIIPVCNEAATIKQGLQSLNSQRTLDMEVIVVDGGSVDASCSLAAPLADKLLHFARGRAVQMNAGAAAARGDVLLFLHADTLLPHDACTLIVNGLAESKRVWGRFDVQIHGQSPMLKVISYMMNLRSRITGIATGDQAIFVLKKDFLEAGGFPQQSLMEDIELSRRLKARSAPLCLHARVTTSGRRWEKYGIWRTIFLMWRLRLRYWLGTPPETLSREYL